ncbi:phosphopantetheine-binding protein [Hydrogenobacter sp. T-2]|uniref:acyl carrier protein n=1 Tax=Pampinifervens diazotrophicum TaxID=1632018 RepID=UPI002B257EBD|nr:phosphopantetheine-binding protein [Hydrogenobacter sp. T-2]WPM32357.1 phosphopantetheine-binding protein [Hydrogenobacter sp. T-2]
MEREIIGKLQDFLGKDLSNYLEEDLIHTGIVDSFGFTQLLLYIEEEFGISFSEEDMEDRNIKTLKGLVEKITNKLSEK